MNLGEIFSLKGDRATHVLMVAVVLGIYAKITGDSRPFAVFVLIVALSFIFYAVNFVLGKLYQ